MVDALISHYNYWLIIILMMLGLYVVVSRGNLVKKIVGLNIFQTSVFPFVYFTGESKWRHCSYFNGKTRDLFKPFTPRTHSYGDRCWYSDNSTWLGISGSN